MLPGGGCEDDDDDDDDDNDNNNDAINLIIFNLPFFSLILDHSMSNSIMVPHAFRYLSENQITMLSAGMFEDSIELNTL
jgi:hypothetical protein